jgi:hypothetical protein
MSTRFNREHAEVANDRLFPDDFQVDQGGQDEDIGRLVKDLGCLPCIGGGLDVTRKSNAPPVMTVSAGWAYDIDGDYGRRITVSSPTDVELPTDEYNIDRFIVIAHKFVTDTLRNAHRTGASYDTRKKDSFEITVETSLGIGDICLAKCVQPSAGAEIQITTEGVRLSRECKLISQDKVPGVIPEGEEAAGPPPPPGSKPELPDYPKGRDVPMPIILSGTRNEATWGGIETILPEELGRTTAASNMLTLERVNLKSGTALADVKVWIGDWGDGVRDGENDRKCNFAMPTVSGATAWDLGLWVSNDAGYYYLVKADESWHSKITDSGATWVICEDDLPDAASDEYYICPYAELYRLQTIPYKPDATPHIAAVHTTREYNRFASPTAPLVTAKELNLGGEYKIKVASVVSGDNYTNWAEMDFVVGSDIIPVWEPDSDFITAESVDGGLKITIPAPVQDTTVPDAYEVCFTFDKDAVPADPSFSNEEHPTVRSRERVFKIDIPPGLRAKVYVRAIKYRMVMKDKTTGDNKVITTNPDDTPNKETYVTSGGIGLRRNRKQFTGVIAEENIPVDPPDNVVVADEVPLPNPIWPERIYLFNPDPKVTDPQTEFEVYIHGSNQDYLAGRKIEISSSSDHTSIGPKASVEESFTDFRITDNAMTITVKNLDTAVNRVNLRYGIQYREDSEAEQA